MKKMLLLAALALALSACQKQTGGKNPFSTVQAYGGGTFFVEMEANVTTGYSWNITNARNLKYVKLTSAENIIKKDGGKIVGAPSVQRFEFSVNPGTAGKTEILNFAYFRPWETGVQPLEQKIYTVNIK